MPEYLSPGVYVEEEERGAPPITGVSTSTAGFVGMTKRGPDEGAPTLVTSYPDFVRQYGGALAHDLAGEDGEGNEWGRLGHLARAVRGFFDNGGRRVYIKRVAPDDASQSEIDLRDGIVTRLAAAPAPSALRLASLRGIGADTALKLEQEIAGATHTADVTVKEISDSGVVILKAGSDPVAGFSPDATRVVVRTPTGPASSPALKLRARDRGAWGDDIQVRVESIQPARAALESSVELNLVPIPGITLDFDSSGPARGATTVDLDGTSTGLQDGDTVEFADGPTREKRTIKTPTTGSGKTTIEWDEPLESNFSGSGASVRIVTAARPSGTAEGTFRVAPFATDALKAGDEIVLAGGGGPRFEANVKTVTPTGSGSADVELEESLASAYLEGATVALLKLAARSGSPSVRVRSARAFYEGAYVELYDDSTGTKEYFEIDEIQGNDLIFAGGATTGTDYFRGQNVRLCEQRLWVRYRNEADGVDQLENFDFTLNERVGPRYVENVVDNRSDLVRVVSVNAAIDFPPLATTESGTWTALAGGQDGTVPDEAAYVGEDRGPGKRTGIQALEEIDRVSIIAAPGVWSQVVQNALILQCERLLDRFAVLDPEYDADLQDVTDQRNLYDTQYAALYHPWLLRREEGKDRPIPPSGHMVGIYARSDNERGVYKAPANEVVRGIIGLQKTLVKREQDMLNPDPTNINVIRDFRERGRGIRVWGSRVITSDTAWKYVNVRRLFIFLEESIEQGTQWAVFEPNDERLWARLTQSVTAFLMTQWREGALFGATPEEAFFVQCDRTTMTHDDIVNGRLIMTIGVAPVRPAEFVIIRIGQWDGGSSVEEMTA